MDNLNIPVSGLGKFGRYHLAVSSGVDTTLVCKATSFTAIFVESIGHLCAKQVVFKYVCLTLLLKKISIVAKFNLVWDVALYT